MTDLTLIIGNKNYSSWSLRPWLAMTHLGLAFNEVQIWLSKPQTRSRILEYSPSGRVPVLQHGDLTVWDSLAIVEYLAEVFPEKAWYPHDRAARAIARAVSAEMHSGFADLRTHMPMDLRNRYPDRGRSPGVLRDIERITQIWQECRQRFGAAGPFLFGEFCIADAFYAPVVSRFLTYDVALNPVSQAYVEAIWALPAMQTWVAAAQAEDEVILSP